MNWVIKRARSVEILPGDRDLVSLMSVINETLGVRVVERRCEEWAVRVVRV